VAAVVILLLFISIVTDALTTDKRTVALAGSVVMCFLYITCGLAFFFYGYKLGATLKSIPNHDSKNSGGGTSRHPTSSQSQSSLSSASVCGSMSLSRRMIVNAFIIMLCFIAEAILWIVSIATLPSDASGADRSYLYTGLFCAFELLSLCSVLVLFASSISTANDNNSHRKTNSKQNTQKSSDKDKEQAGSRTDGEMGMGTDGEDEHTSSDPNSPNTSNSSSSKRAFPFSAVSGSGAGSGSSSPRRPPPRPQNFKGKNDEFTELEDMQVHAGGGEGSGRNFKPQSASSVVCNECDDQRATVRCDECQQSLCVSCSEDLHKTGKRREHAIQPIRV